MEERTMDPLLPEADKLVLQLLLDDLKSASQNAPNTTCETAEISGHIKKSQHQEIISRLEGLNDPNNSNFRPTVFTGYDQEDFERLPKTINNYILQPYIRWARTVVRHETDVVFLTHILLYFSTSVPSAVILYFNFSWWHAVAHWIMQGMYTGPFTLLLHNHIHNNGVLSRRFWLVDRIFPYVLEPLVGHTWNSYFYHHVKCHHVEGNGPEDVSSTLRYQRDSLWHFVQYWLRFNFSVWIELPYYFLKKNKSRLAVEFLFWELSSYALMVGMARWQFWPTLFVLIIPFIQMRIGLMVGNWGQHALVDEIDPESDYRSSITLIDVASNRHCFNDGWHTAHHLNPLRHWRDQPLSYLKAKHLYDSGHALVFCDIDYIFMWVKLMQKDYAYLAKCMVPTGPYIGMSQEELAVMLRGKTRRFSEEEIEAKFGRRKTKAS